MYYKRDGSVEGPLWPFKIKEIVQAKYMKVFTIKFNLYSMILGLTNVTALWAEQNIHATGIHVIIVLPVLSGTAASRPSYLWEIQSLLLLGGQPGISVVRGHACLPVGRI